MATVTQSQLERDIAAFRLRLLRHEAAASQALSIAYADVLAALDGQIIAVSELIADARASGITPSPSWLFQQERYLELRRQTIAAMERYAAQTQQVATASQQAVVRASIQQAGQLLAPVSGGSGGALAQMVSGWAQLPEQSIANMVGALQQGTPLSRSLTRYGPDAVARVTETLVRGMSLGWGADETARQLRSQLNITRASSESLVRTSTMHASRSAMIAAYQESGVVRGWRWTASLSERTCSSCLSKHGKVYSLSTPMASHRSCRCVASPVLAGDTDVDGESGDAWLKRQPMDAQERVLGKQGAAAYRAGEVELDDFSRLVDDPVYGKVWADGGIGWARG